MSSYINNSIQNSCMPTLTSGLVAVQLISLLCNYVEFLLLVLYYVYFSQSLYINVVRVYSYRQCLLYILVTSCNKLTNIIFAGLTFRKVRHRANSFLFFLYRSVIRSINSHHGKLEKGNIAILKEVLLYLKADPAAIQVSSNQFLQPPLAKDMDHSQEQCDSVPNQLVS